MTAQEILNLIVNGAQESRTLDFKRALYGGKDDEKRDFLADVTAMANSQGGSLILGVEETDGHASGLSNLKVEEFDVLKGRYAQLLTSAVDPGLPGVSFHLVKVTEEADVVVIEIPKSWNGPHRVTLAGHSRFYMRTSHGNALMDTAEIRQAMLLSDSATERMRKFREGRVGLISVDVGVIPVRFPLKFVVHAQPIQSYNSSLTVDVARLADFNQLPWFRDVHELAFLNFEGVACSFYDGAGYTQVFRNGVIECVTSYPRDEGDGIHCLGGEAFEVQGTNAALRCLKCQASLGVVGPVFLGLSICGAKGLKFMEQQNLGRSSGHAIDREVLALPEIEATIGEIHDLPTLRMRLSPAIDVAWQAAGKRRSAYIRDDGTLAFEVSNWKQLGSLLPMEGI